MPMAAMIPAIVGGAGSVIGGAMSARAANRAADIQARAAQDVANRATAAGNAAGAGVTDAAGRAIGGFNDATLRAIASLNLATGNANDILGGAAANVAGSLAPYQQAGAGAINTLADLTAPGGELSKRFTAANFRELDPGFDFQLQQGQQALERSAAASGGALGGGTLKSLTQYSQNYANTAFNNAFNRFQTQNTNRFNQLAAVAGFGQNANQQNIQSLAAFTSPQAANLLNAGYFGANAGIRAGEYAGNTGLGAAEYAGNAGLRAVDIAGNALTGGANARAAGTVGAANAWNSALGGVANATNNAYAWNTLRQMTRPGISDVADMPFNPSIPYTPNLNLPPPPMVPLVPPNIPQQPLPPPRFIGPG